MAVSSWKCDRCSREFTNGRSVVGIVAGPLATRHPGQLDLCESCGQRLGTFLAGDSSLEDIAEIRPKQLSFANGSA